MWGVIIGTLVALSFWVIYCIHSNKKYCDKCGKLVSGLNKECSVCGYELLTDQEKKQFLIVALY